MKLLLHVCCAPCTIYPLSVLRSEGVQITGFFFNPNIHPVTEYQKRLSTMTDYASAVDLPLCMRNEYLLNEFLRETVGREEDRCRYCYRMRLAATAEEAVKQGADAFSTTLLYSVYQKHEQIRETGEALARDYGIPFAYRDFRPGWKEGVQQSRELGIYRQKYCGCIYSEMDRYLKKNKPPYQAGAERQRT